MRCVLAATVCAALAAGEVPIGVVSERLARGDARGAEIALASVAMPKSEQAPELAAWLDASARIAWSRGEMDRAFAMSLEALAVAERAGVTLPPLTATLSPGRAWLDEDFSLPLRALPTGDSGARAPHLANRLRSLPEAARPEGAWLTWGARLLDASVSAPTPAAKPARESATQALARRRAALLQAACEARSGDVRSSAAVLRAAERPGRGAEAFARWFQGEALAREAAHRDARLASLRFAQCAGAADDSPWLRVAALRRAAELLETIDPAEAARLRAAADKETP